MALGSGQLFAGYRLVKKVGTGGVAEVWLAYNDTLNEPRALKIIYDHGSDDPTSRERFTRECNIARRLIHPGLVRLYEANRFDGRLYAVMEYVNGYNLEQRLAVCPRGIEAAEVARLLSCFAEPIDYLHKEKHAHRDIKPANLLVEGIPVKPAPMPRVRVADFGVARAVFDASITGTGSLQGTAGYVAPELWGGSRDLNTEADIYALAVTAYKLLAGRLPFERENAQATMAAHLNDPVPGLPEWVLSANARHAVEIALARGMAKSPSSRPPTATAFADDFAAALATKRRLVPPAILDQPRAVSEPIHDPETKNLASTFPADRTSLDLRPRGPKASAEPAVTRLDNDEHKRTDLTAISRPSGGTLAALIGDVRVGLDEWKDAARLFLSVVGLVFACAVALPLGFLMAGAVSSTERLLRYGLSSWLGLVVLWAGVWWLVVRPRDGLAGTLPARRLGIAAVRGVRAFVRLLGLLLLAPGLVLLGYLAVAVVFEILHR